MTIERRVRIVLDEDPRDPREDSDCYRGRLICWHGRYSIGDDHSYDYDTFMRELACEDDDDLEEELYRLDNDVSNALYNRAVSEGNEGYDDCMVYVERFVRPRINRLIDDAVCAGYVVLPVYMYDHSGIALSTGPFGCMWDSGQIGWIVCDNDTIKSEFGGDRDKAEKALCSEIEVYSEYVGGNVYGYIVEERDGDDWEEVDSCYGFYGWDPDTNGMKDYLGDDYANIVE